MTNFASVPADATIPKNRCAVIGHPIAHSLSPLLHRRAYELLGLADFQYDAIDVDENQLDDFIEHLEDENARGARWVGLSVTAPNKQRLLTHGEPNHLAKQLSAGNTLIFGSPNRVYNTDVTGMIAALGVRSIKRAQTAQLMGNGATARSTLAALNELGVEQVQVNARSRERAESSLAELAEGYGIELSYADFDAPAAFDVDLLVNSVPVNLEVSDCERLLAPAAAVFELTYNHYPSNLENCGREADKKTLSGMDLLVYQALDQIELMTGRRPDAEPLLEAGYAALKTDRSVEACSPREREPKFFPIGY